MSTLSLKLLKQRLHNNSSLLRDIIKAKIRTNEEQNFARAMCELINMPPSFIQMWEILVPVTDVHNREIPVEYHQKWDAYVRNLASGLTLLQTAKGTWTHPEINDVITELMIPVRINCSRDKIIKIAQFTKQHYNQHTVLVYLVSTDVIMI